MFDDILDSDTYMKCDIYDIDDKYYIEIDLPGFKRDDINIEFNRLLFKKNQLFLFNVNQTDLLEHFFLTLPIHNPYHLSIQKN